MDKLNVLQMIGEFTSGGAETLVVTLANALESKPLNITITARVNGPVSESLSKATRLVIIPKSKVIDTKHLLQLIQVVKRNRIDIIHTHLFGPNLYGYLVAKITNKKIIQTIHGVDCFGSNTRVMAYRAMLPWVDHIVAVSESLEEDFRQKVGYTGPKVRIIHNGISIEKYQEHVDRQRKLISMGITPPKMVIGTVANVKPVKGLDVLIKSLGILYHKGMKDIYLIIVGIIDESQRHLSEYKKQLDNHIENLGLKHNVKFLGARNDVPEILQCIDIFVLSSRSEGLPVSLLEAMASRKAVVVTNVGLNNRVIENGINGVLVTPESPEMLAEGLLKVLRDNNLRQSLSNMAYETVAQRFSDQRMADDYIRLYRDIVNR